MASEEHLRRRAFQLAHLSEELALTSEHLTDQARAIAEAAAKLARTSEALVSVEPIQDAKRRDEPE